MASNKRGRPKAETPKTMLSVRMEEKAVTIIDHWAVVQRRSRAQMVRVILEEWAIMNAEPPNPTDHLKPE